MLDFYEFDDIYSDLVKIRDKFIAQYNQDISYRGIKVDREYIERLNDEILHARDLIDHIDVEDLEGPISSIDNNRIHNILKGLQGILDDMNELTEPPISSIRNIQRIIGRIKGLVYPDQFPKAKYQRSITRNLRFEIMKRDGHRCQLCGRDASDGIKLEIDHKVAWSEGGTTDLDNLWTLCFDCNRGKHAKDL